MNYPVRTIPPYVRPYDEYESHAQSPNKSKPRSQWATFVTHPPRKFTPEETQAWEEKLAAEAERTRAEFASKALKNGDLTFKERLAKFFRDSDRMLRYSTWWLLFIRFVVVLFSATALGLASSVFYKVRSHPANGCPATPSTYLALVVNTISIPYNAMLMYDEFTHKPINERPFQIRLAYTMGDILAMSFNAANLGVAFELLTDRDWLCIDEPRAGSCSPIPGACRLQKALVAHLIVVQISWIGALYTAIYRIAGRLQPRY